MFSRMFECCAHFHSRRQSVGDDDGAGAPHSTVMAVNMACVFKDSQAVILVDFVPSGSIVNADYYSTLLSDSQLHRKQPNLLLKVSYCSTIMLHHTRLVRQ